MTTLPPLPKSGSSDPDAERHAISVDDVAYAAAAEEGGRRLVSCDERDLAAIRAELPDPSFARPIVIAPSRNVTAAGVAAPSTPGSV